LLALTTGAEFLVEGAITSAFLARVGASALPTALAARAIAEVVLSLGFDRAVARMAPRRALTLAIGLGAVGFVGVASGLGTIAGLWVAYIAASVIARIKTIHFGVLALAELPGPAALRALPAIFAGGRLGAIVAGPLVTLLGPLLGPGALVAGAGGSYALSILFLRHHSRAADIPAPHSADVVFTETEAPPSTRSPPLQKAAEPERQLIVAMVVGAIALACGRLALTTQSGSILEHAYSETELNHVLGLYFVLANALALVLQVGVVGRALSRGGLGLLNSAWAVLYTAAQAMLSLGPPLVFAALGARLVENELRNAVRTPVANVLYDALPLDRRARARTIVIGVAVPAASLVGGLLLVILGSHPLALSVMGIAAALILLVSTFAQNRAFARALGRSTP
jgi:hypothetical protein